MEDAQEEAEDGDNSSTSTMPIDENLQRMFFDGGDSVMSCSPTKQVNESDEEGRGGDGSGDSKGEKSLSEVEDSMED